MVLSDRHTLVSESAKDLPNGQGLDCSRIMRIELDYLLLAIESLDHEAMDAIVDCFGYLELTEVIPNRVSLWRLRNTNPLRKTYQRGDFSVAQARAIVRIIATLANRINTGLRLLVTTLQQMREGKIESLGLQQNQGFLEEYARRFMYLHQQRMKPSLLNATELTTLAEDLVVQLFFSSGTAGEQRLWYTLTAGEIT